VKRWLQRNEIALFPVTSMSRWAARRGFCSALLVRGESLLCAIHKSVQSGEGFFNLQEFAIIDKAVRVSARLYMIILGPVADGVTCLESHRASVGD
jgi:hypothetical protein